ncbi:glycosyltransferase family 2 protein [uncultured Mobiluncus sp.]|uniref:glycosyltransferase family 2 protein n=1 Tax=uncultured Mobiluncus sp. TaxID=293425 RepID=UPI00262BA6B2|nr:glycosyltransferase family 2 protein [uncultured Mobiluncus sp.]
MPKLYSVVVPAHNEGENLPLLLEHLSAEFQNLQWELVIVNDGSSDNTFDVAKTLTQKDKRVRLLSFSRNFGKEPALLAGLRAAKGDAVIIMDADLQHPPQVARQLIDCHERTGADQVIAKRNRKGDGAIRTGFSRLFYFLINKLATVRLTDGEGDFRLLSRAALDSLLSLPEHNRFSKGLYSWIGYPSEVISYDNAPRAHGETNWSMRGLVNYALTGVIGFSAKPLRMISWIGMFGIFLAVIYLIWLLIRWALNGVEVSGYLTTIGIIVLIGSILMTSLGVIAEYVARIFEEVKNRPDYIIAEDIHQ